MELKFDIKKLRDKAVLFNKDKDRAEKLMKKEGYLLFLCSGFEEALMFRAVYTELFPNDKETNDLLQQIISKMVETSEDIILLKAKDKKSIDELYLRFKIYARSTLKQLQRQEIAMIEKIRNKSKEMDKIRQIKQYRRGHEEINRTAVKINEKYSKMQGGVDADLSNDIHYRERIQKNRLHIVPNFLNSSNHFKSQSREIEKDLHRQKNDIHKRKRSRDREFEELPKEILQELLRDREKRKELEKKMPEMIKNIRREEKIKLMEQRKQPVLQKSEIKMLSK